MIAIIISAVAVGICVTIAILGYLNGNEDAFIGGILFGLISSLFGFGMLCGAMPVGNSKTEIIMPENVAKTEFVLFVDVENKTISTKDSKMVKASIESVRVKKESHCNAYGGTLNAFYSIILAD